MRNVVPEIELGMRTAFPWIALFVISNPVI